MVQGQWTPFTQNHFLNEWKKVSYGINCISGSHKKSTIFWCKSKHCKCTFNIYIIEFLLLLYVFFIWSIHLLIFITTFDVIVHVSLENINEKKTYSGCLVMFKQPGSKGGKDQNFMIEYINQTSSEIHINAIVQVWIMPHVLMGHVCSS